MGLSGGTAYPNAFPAGPKKHPYTLDSSPLLLDELDCLGNEMNLLHCTHDGFGIQDCCVATESIAITCDP